MNRQKLYRRYLNFTRVRFTDQVGFLIGVSPHVMELQAAKPYYDTFYVKKRNGGQRLIENPNPVLKQIQRGLNKYLQCVYYRHCPAASHGFVINIKNGIHRSIISNAATHLGAKYIMNIDLKEFFHTVSQHQVDEILSGGLFHFNNDSIRTLSSLICLGGRLPMGAPTSPVMSNLACLELDETLTKFCTDLSVKYTRYADDMAFSSKSRPFTTWEYDQINDIISSYGYMINIDKVSIAGKDDQKKITGIYLKEDGLALSETFFEDTFAEISKLKTILEINQRYGGHETKAVKTHKQMINGYINYASQVYGMNNEEVLKLTETFVEATTIVPWTEPISWSDFPYQDFGFQFT